VPTPLPGLIIPALLLITPPAVLLPPTPHTAIGLLLICYANNSTSATTNAWENIYSVGGRHGLDWIPPEKKRPLLYLLLFCLHGSVHHQSSHQSVMHLPLDRQKNLHPHLLPIVLHLYCGCFGRKSQRDDDKLTHPPMANCILFYLKPGANEKLSPMMPPRPRWIQPGTEEGKDKRHHLLRLPAHRSVTATASATARKKD